MAPRIVKPLTSVLLAFTLLVTACARDSDDAATSDTVLGTEAPAEAVSDDPVEAIPATTTGDSGAPDVDPTIEPDDDTDTATDDIDSLEELDGLDVASCPSPSAEEYYVDVAIDDPDGGLNVRAAPGVEHDIVEVVPRSNPLRPTGACATLETVEWWKVRTVDGEAIGWVSSRYLSEFLVFNPGLGKAIDDPDSVGIRADSLEALAAEIADAYGFDDDVSIVLTTQDPTIDAQGGSASFEMTGLKDDASNGYVVDIDFVFEKDEESGEIEGYRSTKVTNYALCSRGVTDDGLCT